jgi:uncharacterized protein (TIGR02246 family)
MALAHGGEFPQPPPWVGLVSRARTARMIRGPQEVQVMRRAFIRFLPLLMMSALALGQAGGGSDDQGIRQVLAGFVEAWNRHDAGALSMVFAEDADFTNVRGVSAHGRIEIEKFHAPVFATMFKDSVLKIIQSKVRYIKPDVAAVDAQWEMTGARSSDGHEIALRKGLLDLVMIKQAAQWRIAIMHNMELASP